MRDEEFITEVQARAGLSARSDAERVTRATLAVLGEHLPDSVAGPAAACSMTTAASGRRRRTSATDHESLVAAHS